MKPKLIVSSLLIIFLASCSTGTVTNKPDSGTAAASGDSGGAADAAGVGDAITLKTADGSELQVTPQKVIDPATGADFLSKPKKGHHYVAVVVTLELVSGTYNDSPTNGAQLVDKKGQQFDAEIATSIKEATDIGSSVKLTPGDRRLGAIVFMVPNGSTPAQFLFTTDSGFGNTGKWNL